jgi:hypothetical protein
MMMTEIPPELLPIASSAGLPVIHPPGEGAGFVLGLVILGPAAWLCIFLRPYLKAKWPSFENWLLVCALGACMLGGAAVGAYTGRFIGHLSATSIKRP